MSNLASSSATNNDESNNNDNNNNNVSFVTTLWNKYYRDVIFSLYSPFALSMAAGNLPQESFDKYKTQDSYYLNSYYQAYYICTEYGASNSMGVYKDIEKKCMKSAEKYDDKKEIPKDLPEATKNYINFLINTAKGDVEELNIILPPKTDSEYEERFEEVKPKLPAFTLGAMTPCKRLYAFLGTRLKKAMKNPTETITTTTETTIAAATTTTVTKTTETKTTTTINRYKNRWIDENASTDTLKSATNNENLVDGACKEMTPKELGVVENLYKRSLKLEYEFFHAQLLTYQDSVIVPLLNKLKRDDQAQKLHIIVEANAILAGDTYVKKSTYQSDDSLLFQVQNLELLDASGFSSIFCEGGELNNDLLNRAKQSMETIKSNLGEVILQPHSIDFLEKVLGMEEENISIHVIASGDRRGTNVQANELNNDDNNSLTVVIGCSNCNWDQLPNAKIRIKIIGQNSDVRLPEGFSATVPLFDGLVDLQTKYFANSKQLSWNPKVLYTISSWAEVGASILGTY